MRRRPPETDDDTVAEFSSRGSVYDAMKPDLVAPGVSLVSTAAPGSIAVKREQGLAGRGRLHAGIGDLDVRGSGERGGRRAPVRERPGTLPGRCQGAPAGHSAQFTRLEEMDGAGAGALDLGKALSTPVDEDATQGDPEIVSDVRAR